MPRNNDDIQKFIRIIFADHKDYWRQQASSLKRYKNAYESKFWEEEAYDSTMIRVETADAYGFIESYISSLFSKTPSVVIGADIAATGGDPKLAQAAANRFLYNQREQLEIASRLALIYQFSALKLSPVESDEMLDKVTIRALPCWEVMLDRDATAATDQRFIGHTYYLNMVEAKRKFGAKKFVAVPKENYFDEGGGPVSYTKQDYADLPDDYLYIEIVELYDLLHNEVYYWSPSYKNGDGIILRSEIPVRTYNDQPLAPIVPLFYSRSPSKPMEGLSSLARLYDQFYEKNILRTYWANAVRRDSRQYLYREGMVDEESLAKITAGVDGAMIAIDSDTLSGIIQPVGVEPISSNFDRYLAAIDGDINRGSSLAPFARGEATKATATEITALAQYSASEIGKLARERDNSMESIINVYLRTLVLLAEEGDKAVLNVEGEGRVITPEDLEGKFRINALDQGSTPLSDAIRKQNLLSLLPTLQGLGVPPEKIKEEIIRAYELPKNFLEAIPEAPAAPVASPSAADVGNIEGGIGTGETSAQQLATALQGRG
jgi:hypothetical protein